LVPEYVDPEPIAVGLITLLDGDVLLSLFDQSTERAASRQRAVEAYVEMIPRRDETSVASH
jgi:hypothetical protein